MAYVPRQLPEDQENQFARSELTTPNPQPSAGGSAGASATAPGVGSSTQFGSNAAKLSDYLKVNKPQVEAFGNEVAQNLTDTYNQTRGAIDQGITGFDQSVSAGYARPDQTKLNAAFSNPVGFASDPNNVSQFQSWLNNTYSGPQNFESTDDYSNINNRVNQAVEKAGLVGSQGGVTSYLNNFMGGANLTPGMQTLNSALLQRSPEASAAVKNAATPFSGLNDYLSGKISQANQSVQQAKSAADQSRQDVRSQFGQTLNAANADLANRVTAADTARNNTIAKMNQVRSATDFTPEMMSAIGADPNRTLGRRSTEDLINTLYPGTLDELRAQFPGLSADEIFRRSGTTGKLADAEKILNETGKQLDLSKYGTFNEGTMPTRESIASSDDFAKSAALAMLSGNAGDAFLDQSNAGMAGTYGAPSFNYDIGKAEGAVQDELLNAYKSIPEEAKMWLQLGVDPQYYRDATAQDYQKAKKIYEALDIPIGAYSSGGGGVGGIGGYGGF